jgi:hypothetical protein
MTNYPPGLYEQILGLPDDVVWSMLESEPPVRLKKS